MVKKFELPPLPKKELTEEEKELHYNIYMNFAKELEDDMEFARKWMSDLEEEVPEPIALMIIRSTRHYEKEIESFKRRALEIKK